MRSTRDAGPKRFHLVTCRNRTAQNGSPRAQSCGPCRQLIGFAAACRGQGGKQIGCWYQTWPRPIRLHIAHLTGIRPVRATQKAKTQAKKNDADHGETLGGWCRKNQTIHGQSRISADFGKDRTQFYLRARFRLPLLRLLTMALHVLGSGVRAS
jgi:hypothetical protein